MGYKAFWVFMGLWDNKVKEVAIVELNISDFCCFP